jgi:hypothetical protein
MTRSRPFTWIAAAIFAIAAIIHIIRLIKPFQVVFGSHSVPMWCSYVAIVVAGEIHTDFERGFIRAETIAYDDYIRFGGEAGARDAGKLRSEGKDYVVQDGDVMLFRFNV